jgi:hypothetical protein
MVSRSTVYCHATGDRINSIGWVAIVACQYCAKRNLLCQMSSLKKECRNCYRKGNISCVPVEVLVPDFTKLDRELARLDAQEAEVDAAEEKAMEALIAVWLKKRQLRDQRKLLKRREQLVVDESGCFVEEIEALEAVEDINREVNLLEGGLMPGTSALDWGAFMPSCLEGDPGFDKLLGVPPNTALSAVGSL